MRAKQTELALIFMGTGAFMVLLLAGVHFLLAGGREYELRLPDFQNLRGVTLSRQDGGEYPLADACGEDVLFILKGNGRTTRAESIQDMPANVEGLIRVDFSHRGGGTSTVFVYRRAGARNGEYFLEQPYNGIYEISGDAYQAIENYASKEYAR